MDSRDAILLVAVATLFLLSLFNLIDGEDDND